MTESQLITKILRHIAERRLCGGEKIKAIKLPGGVFLEAGTPDLLISHNGQAYLLEAKIGKNKATKLQRRRLAEWSAAGAVTAIVRSVADVERLLRQKIEQVIERRELP